MNKLFSRKNILITILVCTAITAIACIPHRKYTAIPLPDKMKGAWIATVENIDYPSKPGLSVDEQKKEYTDLLDALGKAGINTVFMQVRPTADTFWPSKLDPWSYYLTGKQGKRPGFFYNPLEFMIRETHKRGMSFHAWLNPYRVSNNNTMELAEDSYAKKHPEIILEYGGKKYYNPTRQESRDHNAEIIRELLKYKVDGIHFDDYFYPYPVRQGNQDAEFPDENDYQAYLAAGGNLEKADWRRSEVNKLIGQLHETIKKERPDVAFGISPFGIWRNKSDEVPDGSPTDAFQAYDKLYADTREWIRNGWIDYIMPQIYWHYGHKTAPYGSLLEWWEQETLKQGQGKTKLYIGLALYKHSAKSAGWKAGELEKQLRDIEGRANVHGGVFFSAKFFLKNENNEIDIARNFYVSNEEK